MSKIFLTKEQLYEDYAVNKMTKASIARKYSTSVETINKYFKKFSIDTLPKIERTQDLNGKIFGRLTAIRKSGVDSFGKVRWYCSCSCGNNCIVNASSLLRGLTTSCGCYKIETLRKNGYKDISRSFWRRLKQNANSRGYDFNLTPEYVWEIYEKQNKKCALSGLEISFSTDSNQPHKQTASVDRIDNNKGYIIGNIQIVHKSVNMCRSWLTNEQFCYMCNKVAKNHPIDHEIILPLVCKK